MTKDEAAKIINNITKLKPNTPRRGKIYRMDHTGDSAICTFEPGNAESCKVAQDELTNFLEACVTNYGSKPPVWQKRIGETEFEIFNTATDDVIEAEELLLQYPMAGG